MAGKQQGNLQPAAHQGAHIARIGIVGMNPVGTLAATADVVNELIGQLVQVGPEKFFTEVAPGPEGETHNLSARADGLLPAAVIAGNTTILNQSRDHLNPLHILLSRQGLDQLQYIERLPSRICITAQLRIPRTK